MSHSIDDVDKGINQAFHVLLDESLFLDSHVRLPEFQLFCDGIQYIQTEQINVIL